MISKYLSEVLENIKAKPVIPVSVNHAIGVTKLRVIAHLQERIIHFFQAPKDLQAVILDHYKKQTSADIEENLRIAKLKEIKKQKQLLEAKLSTIDEEIINLSPDGDLKHNRPNLQNARVRQEYLDNEKKKAEEAAYKIQEYYKDQKERERKKSEKLDKIRSRLDQAEEDKKRELEEAKLKKEQEYYEKLEKMKELKARRQKEIEEIKTHNAEYEAAKNQKPLFVRLEEKFKCEYELPELEKRKGEIAKRRLISQSINQEKISEHIKWYESLKGENNKRIGDELNSRKIENKIRSSSCSWNVKVIEDEKHLKEQMSAVNEERLRKIEKRVRYADLIKEMFRPTIDKAKQLEMEQRVLKSKHPIRPIRIASEMNKRSGSFADIEKKRTRPRKIKTQSKTVETPKALKKIDYLSERRKLREDQDKNAHEIDEDIEPDWDAILSQDLSDAEKAKVISERENRLEKKALLKEHLVSSKYNTNLKAIHQHEATDNILLGAIKAKLSILSHSVNNSISN